MSEKDAYVEEAISENRNKKAIRIMESWGLDESDIYEAIQCLICGDNIIELRWHPSIKLLRDGHEAKGLHDIINEDHQIALGIPPHIVSSATNWPADLVNLAWCEDKACYCDVIVENDNTLLEICELWHKQCDYHDIFEDHETITIYDGEDRHVLTMVKV